MTKRAQKNPPIKSHLEAERDVQAERIRDLEPSPFFPVYKKSILDQL